MKRLARGAPGYEDARQAGIWQMLKPDRFPALILAPQDAGEAADAVREAIAGGQAISMKGAGHNFTSTYLREGGVQIDLSALDTIEIEGTIARVGPGARSGDLCAALGAAGRGFPTGHHSGVSMGGYLLGGGMGWNGEHWGQFACFNVMALDVVLASGEAVTIDADRHPDLFWAARGAGPLFPAAVTRFHLRTYDLPTAVRGARMIYPLADADALALWLTAEGDRCRADIELILMFQADPETAAPYCMVLIVYHGSDAAAGEAALQSILAGAPAGAAGEWAIFPLDYAALYAESMTGDPRRTGAESSWSDDPIEATRIFAARMTTAPSSGTVAIVNFRGAPALPADAACSVSGRVFLQWTAQWTDPAADPENFAWVAATAQALDPLTLGCYVNETDVIRRPERMRLCFSPSAWSRLAEVRARYDPDGRFPAP